MTDFSEKLKLHGFNNLTKHLSFSFYQLHYVDSEQAHIHYQNYINHLYNAEQLNKLLHRLCKAIGGTVLNIAKQDYQPQGASVTLMISEEAEPTSLVAHLDKSHLCIHTYPDDKPTNNIAIFRADIELSTCGVISPLKVLNYLMSELSPDVADIDYRIRGMTRDIHGEQHFNDHLITSIEEFLTEDILRQFNCVSYNLPEANLFHSKLSASKPCIAKAMAYQSKSVAELTENNKIEEKLDAVMKSLVNSS